MEPPTPESDAGAPQMPPAPEQVPPAPQPMPPGYAPAYGPYGMQPVPYYIVQKKGMPGWAWVLIVLGVLVILCPIGGIFALAAIPLITSNTRDARRAEGEQLMGSARDATRVEYSKTGTAPARLSAFSRAGDFAGEYYQVDDAIESTATQGKLRCTPIQSKSDGYGRIEFNWADGYSNIRWD